MGYYWGQELYHYGVKRRSGRYPYGSGDRPFQSNKAERLRIRKEKNVQAGRERLQNRIKNANKIAKVDKYAGQIGWKATQKSGDAHARVKHIKEVSNEILKDEARLEQFGKTTRKERIWTSALTAASATTVGISGMAWLTSVALAPLTAAIPIAAVPTLSIALLGREYLKKSKY